VEVSAEGVLLAHMSVLKPKPHHPSVNPLINGVTRLDGVDNNMIHLVHTNDQGALVGGIGVRAIRSEKRRSHILDLVHFRPG
jgi:hypothetical protein